MLSIVIPHYNSVSTLVKLLDSIPKKDDIEIIVVDDNSDRDQESLEKLINDQRFRHVSFYKNISKNKGAGACRNIGLQKLQGEWVLFADADDYLLEDFYTTVKKYFNTDNDVVFFTPTSIVLETGDEADRHIVYKNIIENYIKNKDRRAELSLRYQFPVPWSKLINVKFLKENKITFDEVIASNDVMFSTKVGHHMKRFQVTNETIYCVTKNKGSLTVNLSEKIFDARLLTHIKYHNYLKSKLSSDELLKLELKGSMGFLINTLKYNLGLKKLFSTYLLLRKSRIKIFDLKYLNPIFFIKRVIYQYRIYIRDKKYYIKD